MTSAPAVSLRAAVRHDLVGDSSQPIFVADAVDAILGAPSDEAAADIALDRFRDIGAAHRERLFTGVVHALRVAARGPV